MPGKKLVAPFAEEEYSLDLTRQNLVNWNLLYQQALPLSFPFIIPHATWKEKEYYIHHCPANISAEIVLEGSLQFTLEDRTRILRANELIFLPIGEPNRICTGAEGFTRKAVFGIRGFLAEPILASFSLESGKIYRLQDPARILQMLSHLVTLYRKQDPALLNRASAAAFEILLEIRDQICEKSANIASLIQSVQQKIQNGCSIPELARANRVSRSRMNRIFRRCFNQSPQQYSTRLRMQTAEQFLLQGEESIKWIATQTGYHSLSRFAAAFRKYHGVSPREYRKRGKAAGDLPEKKEPSSPSESSGKQEER